MHGCMVPTGFGCVRRYTVLPISLLCEKPLLCTNLSQGVSPYLTVSCSYVFMDAEQLSCIFEAPSSWQRLVGQNGCGYIPDYILTCMIR